MSYMALSAVDNFKHVILHRYDCDIAFRQQFNEIAVNK